MNTLIDSRPTIDSVEVVWETDEDADLGYVGCYAKATVSYPTGDARRLETFRSGGLWGIEDELSQSYQEEVEAGQLTDLEHHLERFGVDVSNFDERTL